MLFEKLNSHFQMWKTCKPNNIIRLTSIHNENVEPKVFQNDSLNKRFWNL